MNRPRSIADWLEYPARAVGIVFTDIVGSTFLLYRERTTNYTVILGAHRARAMELTRRLDGRLAGDLGDGFLALFHTASDACCFAREFLSDSGHPQVRVRVGVHFGTVTVDLEHDSVTGLAVHYSERVMKQGRHQELWVSDVVKQAIDGDAQPDSSGIAWLASKERRLRGFPGRHRLWRTV